MSNLHLHPRYDERIVRLAVGVEPLDAHSGQRLAGPLRVLVEAVPTPVHRWRRWRPGETLDEVLPALDRHRSGRFGRVYDGRLAGGTTVLRVVDAVAGRPLRRIVPRRVEVGLADAAAVTAADAAGTPHPLWRRTFPLALFPGAAAPVPGRATAVRGRVVRVTDPATGAVEPVRWPRVFAAEATGEGEVVGWAHGDDRGEFLLVVEQAGSAVVVPDDPLQVELTVGATEPPLAPDPADPQRPAVDPLWDLPVEPLPATPTPATDGGCTGRLLLGGQTAFGPFPLDLPLGRETPTEIQIP